MSSSPVSEPHSRPSAPRRWPVTLTVLMGTVAVVLNATVVNVAIPPIMAAFGMSQIAAQWVSTGFLAAMTATMLASARVMERLGQRRTFQSALCVFVLASLLAAASPNAATMIFARVLQGAAAGVIQPLAMVLIFQVFDDSERGKALGLYGMGVVLAPAIGPTIGGVLIDWLSWRAVYLPGIPFALLALWGARHHLGNDIGRQRHAFDWLGLGLLSVALAALLTGLSLLTDTPGRAAWLIAGGGVALAAFIGRVASAAAPLIQLSVLGYPRFAVASVLAMIYGAGLYGSTYLVPLLAQGVQRFSATATGVLMMPAGLVLMLVFPIAGRLADRVPAWRLMVVGSAGFAIGLVGLAYSGPQTSLAALAAWLAFGRMASGLMMPALNIDGLRALPQTLTHQGSGMINFARQLGGAVGVNIFALLLQTRISAHLGRGAIELDALYAGKAHSAHSLAALSAGFRETLLVMALLFIAGLILAAWTGYSHAKLRQDSAGL